MNRTGRKTLVDDYWELLEVPEAVEDTREQRELEEESVEDVLRLLEG